MIRPSSPLPVLPVLTSLTFCLVLFFPKPVLAAAINEVLPDEQGLSQLELRAQQANPREQCFLYTELVHTMTEMAGKEMLAGDVDHASVTLKRVQHYAELIHLGLANDTKRLKNAELLMSHTNHRLADYMRAASSEDRETLRATLKQLNQIQDELLTQVFKH